VGALRAYTHAMIHTAAGWDVLGASGILPSWWPPVSYVLAGAAVASGCTAVLLAVLTARARPRAHATADPSAERPLAAARARPVGGGQLLALGILLAAWLLRGAAEIPPDLPLVAAEVLAAALYALFALRHRN
jgi:hypothetical protein